MNLGIAIAIAAKGFENKTDKAGEPYILHCLRVMNGVDQNDKELMAMAVLHDVVEDGVCTINDLISHGFSQRVLIGVITLTHNKDVSYDDYIKHISACPDAVKVKLADLKDNSNITRLKGLTKKDFDRMEKYHRSYTYLSKI
jgi:(p)ppGpp synthase/HD superfamily hydrolase